MGGPEKPLQDSIHKAEFNNGYTPSKIKPSWVIFPLIKGKKKVDQKYYSVKVLVVRQKEERSLGAC